MPTASSTGGSLYRSLTAPSMSGYISDLLPNPDHMMLAHAEGNGPCTSDFFLVPDEYMDVAEFLLQDANTPPAAAAAAGAAAGPFHSSPTTTRVGAGAGAGVGTPRARGSSSGRANSGDMLVDTSAPTGTPTSAAAYSRLAAAAAAAAAAGANSPHSLRPSGLNSNSNALTEEQMLFASWRDLEPQGSAGGAQPAGPAGVLANMVNPSGQYSHLQHSVLGPASSNAASILLPYGSQANDHLLLVRSSGGSLTGPSGVTRVGDALLLPAQFQHRLVSAAMPAAAVTAGAAAAAAAAVTGPPSGGLGHSQLLMSALRRASSNAQSAAGAAAAHLQLPPVPALRLTPPAVPAAAATAAPAVAQLSAAAASMRTISSVTNDLTASLMDGQLSPPSLSVPAIAAAGVGSPSVHNTSAAFAHNNLTNNNSAHVVGRSADPHEGRAQSDDSSEPRLTRSRSKVAATAIGGPDSSSAKLKRVDSDVTHPKKRAKLGAVAPAGMAEMEAAALAGSSKPTGPAQGM
jgi:hypothetical protein